MLDIVIWLIVIGSSLWVYWDAKNIGIRKGQINGILNMSAAAWSITCLLIWIIGFPLYLYKRPEYKRINEKNGSNTGPTLIGLLLIALVILLTSVSLSESTHLSTSELSSQVKANIIHNFANNQEFEGDTVKSFILIHNSGNEYKGILKVTNGGQQYTYVVNVTYDGKKFMWQIGHS